MDQTPALESQREYVPRTDTGELDTALAFLDFVRACVLKKLDGLDDEQLRRRMVRSETNLLGLVQHLTVSEQYWFHHVAGGKDPEAPDDDWEFSMEVPPERTVEEVVRAYREAIAESNAVVRTLGDPESATALAVDESPMTLRWVLAHMTGEVARHAGHADLLRELIDGTTGR